MSKNEIFIAILSFYADKKPHKIYEQFYWLKNINRKLLDKDFLIIHRKLFLTGLIKNVGKEYFKVNIAKRRFILTDKGDEVYRNIAVASGGEWSYYKKFVRKDNNEITK